MTIPRVTAASPQFLSACLLTALFLLVAAPAAAIQFAPIEMTFGPSGREAVRTFRLENDSEEPVAVELGMFHRSMTPQGKDELTPAEDDFIVVPEQVVLIPGQVQWIRVQWVGNPSPSEEIPFRFVAEQLPIDIGEQADVDGGVIRLLVRYLASVYVAPKGAASDIELAGVQPANATSGEQQLLVRLHNKGNAHEVINGLRLTLTHTGGQTETLALSADELTDLGGRNVLAGVTRELLLPWPETLPAGPLSGRLELLDQ